MRISRINAELDGPKAGVPGTEIEAAMPEADIYVAEVFFLNYDRKSARSTEIAKATFDFDVKPLPKPEAATPPQPPPSRSNRIPPYIWAVILLIVGITLGKFGGRIYKSVFSA